MNKFLSVISDIRVVIAIAVLVVLLTVWLIVEKVRTKHYRQELEELEQKYNDIKSVPLTVKITKARALAKGNSETARRAEEAGRLFDLSQAAIAGISGHMAECEDAILVGQLRKADEMMRNLEKDITLTDKEVHELDVMLDEILAKDNKQRQDATSLKNRFRALKSSAQENASHLSYCWEYVESRISDTEKMFSTFEDWTFSGDYDKAADELKSIQENMKEIDQILVTMPSLLEDGRGVIPNLIETLRKEFSRNRAKGVYLKHLEVEKNLSVVEKMLNDDMISLATCKTDGIEENFTTCKARLNQMLDAVRNEAGAYDQMKSAYKSTKELYEQAVDNYEAVAKGLDSSSVKFGLEGMSAQLEKDEDDLKTIGPQLSKFANSNGIYQMPASSVMLSMNELKTSLSACNDSLVIMRNKLQSAVNDEDRIRKELVKLQIIMNQMTVKIRKYKLPNISDTFREDMDLADHYIEQLTGLLEQTPINIQVVSSILQEALDFIYKLYNNVNNVVGTVVMVENTIVFGNRYRSTYADIDSELTRSELCFRNGEYTQALTTAIATIEKIHPGNYESMIRENAKGA